VGRKNGGDEPIWHVIHIYMEMSQGNSLKQTKVSFFQKLEDRRENTPGASVQVVKDFPKSYEQNTGVLHERVKATLERWRRK
jgi:hypothetical protein